MPTILRHASTDGHRADPASGIEEGDQGAERWSKGVAWTTPSPPYRAQHIAAMVMAVLSALQSRATCAAAWAGRSVPRYRGTKEKAMPSAGTASAPDSLSLPRRRSRPRRRGDIARADGGAHGGGAAPLPRPQPLPARLRTRSWRRSLAGRRSISIRLSDRLFGFIAIGAERNCHCHWRTGVPAIGVTAWRLLDPALATFAGWRSPIPRAVRALRAWRRGRYRHRAAPGGCSARS